MGSQLKTTSGKKWRKPVELDQELPKKCSEGANCIPLLHLSFRMIRVNYALLSGVSISNEKLRVSVKSQKSSSETHRHLDDTKFHIRNDFLKMPYVYSKKNDFYREKNEIKLNVPIGEKKSKIQFLFYLKPTEIFTEPIPEKVAWTLHNILRRIIRECGKNRNKITVFYCTPACHKWKISNKILISYILGHWQANRMNSICNNQNF